MLNKDRAIFVVASAVFAAAVVWMVYFVPPNMDEVIQFHRLACWSFDGSKYNTFRQSCDAYLSDFLGIKFHRSYAYIGITSSLLYAPLYKLIPCIYSDYLMGLTGLIIFALLLANSLGLNWRSAIIPLLYFPFAFLMIHDTGPVRVALLSYPIAIYAATKILEKDAGWKKIFTWVLAAGLIISIAIEDKPFYVYLLPQVLIIAFACALYKTNAKPISIITDGQDRLFLVSAKVALWVLLFALFIGIGMVSILVLTKEGTRPYIVSLVLKSEGFKRSFLDQIPLLTEFVVSPISYSQRIYDIPRLYKLISFLLSLPLFFLAAIQVWSQKRKCLLWLALSSVVLCSVFLIRGDTSEVHHFLFLHVPVLVLLMYWANVSRRNMFSVLNLLVFGLLVDVALLTTTATFSHTTPSRSEVFNFLAVPVVAENNIINFSSWGGYSLQSLYGHPAQIVTWVNFDNTQSADSLTDLLGKTGRSA